MDNHKLVLPEHLNQFGYLFGGYLLQWIDECAWIAATLDFPGCNFVTMAMDKVEFRNSVRQGDILRIRAEKVSEGRTSVRYTANVYRDGRHPGSSEPVFSTNITFVRIDGDGRKMPIKA